MTRRKRPTPFVMVTREGANRAVVLVPRTLRDRYKAVAEMIGTEMVLTITDLDTGGIAEVRGDRVTLSAAGTPESIGRFSADALTIARAAARRGRPRGTPVTEDRILAAVAELRKAGRLVTLDSIVAASGVFSYHQLRYYLRVSGRKLSDYR